MTSGAGRGVPRARRNWLPLAAALGGTLLSVIAWAGLLGVHHAAALRAAAAELETVRRIAETSLDERLEALARLAWRWERQGGRSEQEFALEAEVLRESYPSMRAIGWADSDLRVRWVFPRDGNEAALGFDVNADPVRKAAYDRASREGEAFTPPLELVQGGTGILGIVPIRPAGAAGSSFVYAAVDPVQLLETELQLATTAERLRVFADGVPLLTFGDTASGPTVSDAFDLGGVEWRITLTDEGGRAVLPHLILALGAALSVMLGLALRGRAIAARAAEEARVSAVSLAASERRHRGVVDAAVDAVVVMDARGTVQSVNPAVERVFGYAADEVVGSDVAMLIRDGDAGTANGARGGRSGLDRLTEAGRDLEGRRKDGTIFPIEAAVGAWQSGGERWYAAILRDVTERKRAEREATDAARFLQAVIDGALDPIFVKDRDGRMLLANKATAEVFGVAQEDLVGRRDADFLRPELAAALTAADRRVIETGEPQLLEETVERDGVVRVFLSAKTPLRDAAGTVAGLIGVARDVTDRTAAEGEIRRLNADLERRVEERTRQLADAAEELRAFAYSVAHDLRAPLRGMRGFSQALLEDHAEAMDDTARDYTRRIADAAARLDLLIEDLLAYARLGRQEVPLGPVPLGDAVQAALAQLETPIREAGAVVEVEPALPTVRAHRGVLVQVVANLLSNAVKFVPPDRPPHVTVRAERRDGCVRISVEDNGVGIAPEHRDRIFRVFERLHGLAEYPGTGIGLAIVRRGAERMGGAAGVDAADGPGSRFWIELKEAADGA